MEFAKMLLQRFAEESETTDSNEVEETEDTIEQEYTDGSETEEAEESNIVEEDAKEPEKVRTFTQDEVNEMMDKRIKRERRRLDREYQEELSKYKELAYLTKEGLETDDLDEALDKTREFYDKKGIKYSPEANTRDEEILANAYAQEILDDCDSVEDIEDAIKNLSKKGAKMTNKDALVIKGLDNEVKTRKRLAELSALGVSEEVYNSKEFKDFESKFAKETPIGDIYEIYNTTKKAEKHIQNPGSMKSIPSEEKKDFITESEYDRMTDEEIEKNLDLIHKSMPKWYK